MCDKLSKESAEMIFDDDCVCVCVCRCLSVFVHILFFFSFLFFVGRICFVNSCLRILACGLGGETLLVFVSAELTNTWVGRGTTPASYVYIYILYTDMTTFKKYRKVKKRRIDSCIYCCKSSYSANWQKFSNMF